MSYTIKDTTKEEREQIVAYFLGNINASCEGCAVGLAEMYQGYIDGKRKLKDIDISFRARYISGEEGLKRERCGFENY